MPDSRLADYRSRLGSRLSETFEEGLPPRDVAATFAFGTFVASMPNLGIALVLFAAVAYHVERASNLALVTVLVVMNPPVKWGIYLVSLWLGTRLLGPAEGVTASAFTPAEFSVSQLLSVGPPLLTRLVVGNLLVSALLAAGSYVLVLVVVRDLRRRELALLE
jgi:uncharacterized protein (DUF2062 family)